MPSQDRDKGAKSCPKKSQATHEFHRGALPGSINIPLPVIQQAMKQLDRNTPVLVYCGSGQRSGTAKRILEACGFVLVHNLGSRAFYNDCNQR